MKTTRSCPEPAVLKNFLMGRVDSAASDIVAEHLGSCSECMRAAETLNQSDEVIEALRVAAFAGDSDEHLNKALAASADLFADRETLHEPTVNTSDGVQLDAGELEGFEFLLREARSGELGRVGDYRLLKLLGRGGMGVVFLAEDTVLKRQVALKLLQPGAARNPAVRERFVREAQAAAGLDHDNIVHVYQVGLTHEAPYLAMQLLKGESLAAYLKQRGRLEPSEVARMGSEIASGLAAAHQRGLIHRDIKPDNLWVEPTGRVKILDFGLARDVQSNENMTVAGALLGTPRYMSPEQAIGNPLDARSDLFSLGSVLFEMLTGKPAFEGPNLVSILMAISKQTPESWDSQEVQLDREFKDLLKRLLAKEPDARPAQTSEVAEQLAAIASRLAQPQSKPQPKTVSKTLTNVSGGNDRGTHRRWMVAAAAGAAALFLGIVIYVKLKDGRELRVEVPDDVEELRIVVEDDSQTPTTTDSPTPTPVASHYDPTPVAMPGSWKAGPDPQWSVAGVSLKTCPVLPGICDVSRVQENGLRWNYETTWPRGYSDVAKVSPDGTHIAIGSQDGATRVYSVEGFELQAIFPGYGGTQGVMDLSWSSDSQSLAIIADGTRRLRVWTVSGRLVHEALIDGCTSVAWHPSESLLAVGTYVKVNLFRINAEGDEPEEVGSIDSGAGVRCLKWSLDGSRLALTDRVSSITVHDYSSDASGTPIFTQRFRKEIASIKSFEWGPNGELAILVGESLEVLDAEGEMLKRFAYSGNAICWDNEGRRLFGHLSMRGLLFELETGNKTEVEWWLWSFTEPNVVGSFPDGRWFVITQNLAVASQDLKKVLFESPINPSAMDVQWSADGEQLLIATYPLTKGASILKTDRWGVYQSRFEFSQAVVPSQLAVGLRDEHLVATVLNSGLWRVSGESVVPLNEFDASMAAWSHDGEYCAVGTSSGQAVLFDSELNLVNELSFGDDQPTGAGEGYVLLGWEPGTHRLALARGSRLYWTSEELDWKVQTIVDAGQWLGGYPTWGPAGDWIDIHGIGRWSLDGERVELDTNNIPQAWQPDGEARGVVAAGSETWLVSAGGLKLRSRVLNGSLPHLRKPVWNPRHAVIGILQSNSLVNLVSADSLEPLGVIVLISGSEQISFSAAGELLGPASDDAKKSLVKLEMSDEQVTFAPAFD